MSWNSLGLGDAITIIVNAVAVVERLFGKLVLTGGPFFTLILI